MTLQDCPLSTPATSTHLRNETLCVCTLVPRHTHSHACTLPLCVHMHLPPPPHKHAQADHGLSQGQVHKVEWHLDFCSDWRVTTKAGSRPESALPGLGSRSAGRCVSRPCGPATGGPYRLADSGPRALPACALALTGALGSSPTSASCPATPGPGVPLPASLLCGHQDPTLVLPLPRSLPGLLCEAGWAASPPHAQHTHTGLEGLASVSVLGWELPGVWGVTSNDLSPPHSAQAWSTGAQSISWTAVKGR